MTSIEVLLCALRMTRDP
ncbi:hypothetical protein LINPERPRIM_LOCUS7760 [Linum perenne]